MACYFPLNAYKAKAKDPSKIEITFHRSKSWRGQEIRLPCGQCIGCRLERARQWAVRCVHEASLHEKNCFLTLTYNQENLPEGQSLCLDHFQKFMKRLRRKYGSGIRFFHCGEYGDELGRPHYHALLFNFDFDDKKYWSEKNGNKVYTSESLSTLWPYGFGVIGDVTFESAGYVARYALKKVTGASAPSYYGDKKPPYVTMSRRPGIGYEWFNKYRGDVYPLDRVIVRGVSGKAPRYYDGLLQKSDPALLAWLKIEREKNEKFVGDVVNGKHIIVSDSSDRRLIVKNEYKESQIKTLSRHKDGV